MRTIIIQNETFRRSLKFTDIKTGAVLDLTGCTAFAQMRDKPGGTRGKLLTVPEGEERIKAIRSALRRMPRRSESDPG